MKNQRLILFIELVRGCNNTTCPSHGVICKFSRSQPMNLNVLSRAVGETGKVLAGEHSFGKVDIWPYGVGDTLDHPRLDEALGIVHAGLGRYGEVSMAIDSLRQIPSNTHWLHNMDKIKISHKAPETYDWEARAREWARLPIEMSHKLITNRITREIWEAWLRLSAEGVITELKAVPWHSIPLGEDDPPLTLRSKMQFDDGLPVVRIEYQGLPLHRAMICHDGSLRRCLVKPTEHTTIQHLLLGSDEFCKICFPITGGEMLKFYNERITVSGSSTCVSNRSDIWSDAALADEPEEGGE